jgi:hypothetical protein
MDGGRDAFAEGLRSLGFSPSLADPNRVAFDYTIRSGRFAQKKVQLGFEVGGDFPRNPPGGPHMNPHLLPMNPGAPAHPDRVAPSAFGDAWQYWSRPHPHWTATKRTVAAYMAYVESLFASLK